MSVAILDTDYDKASDVITGPFAQLQRSVADAIAVERERCARVAENMGRSGGRVLASHQHVADQIRSGNLRIKRRASALSATESREG